MRGFLRQLSAGLARTREGLRASLQAATGGRRIEAATLEELEAALVAADLGPALAAEVIAALERGTARGDDAHGALRAALLAALPAAQPAARAPVAPHVVFVVGVNGGGKTTTVGKLAARERGAGRSVLVVAADTFRAAAIDQLSRWTERAGVELLRGREGADPAALVFDALRAARGRATDTVLVDTAGRLHTKTNLMAELEKLARIAAREVPGAPHEVLLVIDATTGQNGLVQAQEFSRAAPLTGVVLTKLDGTAKGGIALVIQRRLGVPVRWVGVGEGLADLLEFDAQAYVDGLLEERA